MTQLSKLIKKIFSNSQISYNDAEKVLFYLDYRMKITSSHHIFKKEKSKQIVLKKRAKLFEYQVLELREALRNHGYTEEN